MNDNTIAQHRAKTAAILMAIQASAAPVASALPGQPLKRHGFLHVVDCLNAQTRYNEEHQGVASRRSTVTGINERGICTPKTVMQPKPSVQKTDLPCSKTTIAEIPDKQDQITFWQLIKKFIARFFQ